MEKAGASSQNSEVKTRKSKEIRKEATGNRNKKKIKEKKRKPELGEGADSDS